MGQVGNTLARDLVLEWREREAFRCQMGPGDLDSMAHIAVLYVASRFFSRGVALKELTGAQLAAMTPEEAQAWFDTE